MMTRPPHAQAVLFAVWNWLHSARVSHNSGSALLRIVCFVGLVAGGLLLSTAPTAHGQSVWDSPEPSSNPWQIDRSQAEEDNNPWAVDDAWNSSDPWGTEDVWSSDRTSDSTPDPSRHGEDWARDFYDFSDDEEEGSARRVGDGVQTNAGPGGQCFSNNDCTAGGGRSVCCVDPSTGVGTCGPGNGRCNGTGGGGSPLAPGETLPSGVPVDGGLFYLIALGLGLGAYKLT